MNQMADRIGWDGATGAVRICSLSIRLTVATALDSIHIPSRTIGLTSADGAQARSPTLSMRCCGAGLRWAALGCAGFGRSQLAARVDGGTDMAVMLPPVPSFATYIENACSPPRTPPPHDSDSSIAVRGRLTRPKEKPAKQQQGNQRNISNESQHQFIRDRQRQKL